MRSAYSLLLAFVPLASGAINAQYLPRIQQRWDASDLVCIGSASPPDRTGLEKSIDGAYRDQLSAAVNIERCFKGVLPSQNQIQVLGYNVISSKELKANQGYAYSGPPAGFVDEGRNLLFLRRTTAPNEFEVTVPIYKTAIRLAEFNSDATTNSSDAITRSILTRELEAALLKFENDLSYIDYIFDLLGERGGASELTSFSKNQSSLVQGEIAVALFNHGSKDSEPGVISLLLDSSAPPWKRENAALALGFRGTESAIAPLQKIAEQPADTEELKPLRLSAEDGVARLKHRLLDVQVKDQHQW